jgi:acetate kinase
MAKEQLSSTEMNVLLNKRSGFLGLCGAADLRAVQAGAAAGDARCALAAAVFVRRVRKYLGAYWVALNGEVDAVVFSGGIGENAAEVRARVCEGMAWAGMALDAAKNAAAVGVRAATEIQAAGSRVKVLVVPTDEELSIAEQTLAVVAAAGTGGGGGGGGGGSRGGVAAPGA